MEPVMYDSHMHTPLCKHAIGVPSDFARSAVKRRLKGIIFTCHNPAPDGWAPKVRMELEEYERYVDWVERTREEWKGRVDVLLGLESDYAPGMESFLEKLHARVPLNFILGSVHPQLPDYRGRYFQGDVLEFRRTYFGHLGDAAECGLFHAVSHPDLIKNCYAEEWNIEDVMGDICRMLDRVARTGVALELNTSGQYKPVPEMNPGPRMLSEMRAREIPVVVGSDAHDPGRVGCSFLEAFDLLEAAGYAEVHYFVRGERLSIPILSARESMGTPIGEERDVLRGR